MTKADQALAALAVACHQWLERELDVLRPDAVLVALGATAGQSLFGPNLRRAAELAA